MNQPQAKEIELSDNGVIYLSSGFEGPYIMQVIACKESLNEYQLCLTDGKLYIGGKYASQNKIDIQTYNIVKIQCRFVSRWSPIQIMSLQVISDHYKSMLGRIPMTIHDYFLDQKQYNQSSYHSTSDRSQQQVQQTQKNIIPRKKVKLMNDNKQINGSKQLQQQSQNFLNTKTQKFQPQKPFHYQNFQNQSNLNEKFKYDSQPQIEKCPPQIQHNQNLQKKIVAQLDKNYKENQFQKQRKAQEISSSDSQVLLTRTQRKQKVYVAQQHQIVISKQIASKNQTHNVYISELYQRMLRWKILCRVVSLRVFLSAKGKKCALMYLIDQKGDQIKAIYYYNKNSLSNPADCLMEGKIYSFSGGEVVKTVSQQYTCLQIILDAKCEITEYESIFIYPYNAKKITPFKELPYTQDYVNLIGMVKSFEIVSANPSNYKSKPKIKGVLCNPLQLYQIQFHKFLYGGEKELSLESLYVFNNFKIMQSENAIKLIGSNNSYIVRISQQDIQYKKAKDYLQYHQLTKYQKQLIDSKKKWKKYQYLNMSEIKYSKRTISQLKIISNETDSIIYSQILVSIADIKLKKQYMACPICKRSTIQQQHILYQCLKCKKIVDPSPTLIVNLVLADATGSFQIDVFGQKVNTFIGVESSQFCSLNPQQKQCTLQIAKFSQFVVKIKSQRKSPKQLTHCLQQAAKQEHTLTMQQIRRRTVQQKLKLEQRWDQFD